MARVGKALRAARERAGLSLNEAAEAADITPSMLSRVENGKVDVRLLTLTSLAKVLGFSLDGLARDAGLLPSPDRSRVKPAAFAADDLAPLGQTLEEARRIFKDLERRAVRRH